MANVIKKKMSGKDWNAKALLGLPKEIMSLALGTLYGIASDVTSVTSNIGEILEGLKGQFVFVAPDGTRISSYILWMPSGMGSDIFESARKKESIEFAFKVHVERAENPAGYQWAFEPLVEMAQSDPLAVLEAKLAGKLVAPEPAKAIEAPEPAKAIEAPKEKAPK